MKNRRLALNRERLTQLGNDELAALAGAISSPHPTCVVTSVRYSQCPTCGIACSYQCPTRYCPPSDTYC